MTSRVTFRPIGRRLPVDDTAAITKLRDLGRLMIKWEEDIRNYEGGKYAKDPALDDAYRMKSRCAQEVLQILVTGE